MCILRAVWALKFPATDMGQI